MSAATSEFGPARNFGAMQNLVAIRAIADMARLATGSTRSRMTLKRHPADRRLGHSRSHSGRFSWPAQTFSYGWTIVFPARCAVLVAKKLAWRRRPRYPEARQ